jgi:NAD(P)-dependent dehydrogenase (short-subunit alcohol dehydrogenase family)
LRGIADELSGVQLRTLDVTSDESVNSCIGSILTDLGGIDLLVNNAGAGHRGTLEQLTKDELSHALELNFFGVARVTKAVLPAMRAARTGRVITVTSLNGVVALPFSDAYNAAKFAVEGLMESLATVMREFDVYISVLERAGANRVLRQCRWARRQRQRRRSVRGTHQSIQPTNGCARLEWSVRRISRRRDPRDRRRPVTRAALPVVGAIAGNRCTEAGRHHRKEHPGRDPANASSRMRPRISGSDTG